MEHYLYRFRSIDKLLGKFQELERQQIYFAAPDELNDPLEGYRDVFWRGDSILFSNLFRHYILCLQSTVLDYLVFQETTPIDPKKIPVRSPYSSATTEAMRNLQDGLVSWFFSNELIGKYSDALAQRKHPIRASEIATHLRNIHGAAFVSVVDHLHNNNLLAKTSEVEAMRTASNRMLLNSIETLNSLNHSSSRFNENEELGETLFSSHNRVTDQINLVDLSRNSISNEQKNRLLIQIFFPELYLREIDQLTYHNWYTASFMRNHRNSAAWGHYGDSHRGVCLKFKVDRRDGNDFIKLRGIRGWGAEGPIRSFADQPFHKVNYQADPIEVDFFKSLGAIPIPVISKEWYHDFRGNRSTHTDGNLDFSEEYRAEYHEKFIRFATTKSIDWQYEDEHRLVLRSFIFDLSDPKDRLLEYEFSCLDGIIFGIKTSTEDKLSIMKLIELKCRDHGRQDFNFYQAYYCTKNRSIENYKMPLIRVS